MAPLRRESRARGWDGRFRRVYLPFWAWFLGLLAGYATVAGAIVWMNFFAVDGIAV